MPLVLVLTSRRVLYPRKKLFAVADDVVTAELPVPMIRSVSWRRPSTMHRYGLAGLLFLGGLIWSLADVGSGAIVIGFPTAMVLVAPVFPLLARRKRTLTLRADAATFSWTAPVTFGRDAAEKLASIEVALRTWTSAVGLTLEEDP
ncbi:MAG: hypothetical protein INH41_10205 [Myxococcaceae bacterium]|nr:hypothetical protein [Myxococcaceae bacterium]